MTAPRMYTVLLLTVLGCVAACSSSPSSAPSSGPSSAPTCDCPTGNVCDDKGDCVVCAPTDACASDDDCGAGSCVSIVGECACIADGALLTDPLGDQFINGDPNDVAAVAIPALDIETVALTCSAGILRVTMRVAETHLATSVDPASYGFVLTETSGETMPGGLYGDGVVNFRFGTANGGSLACLNQRYDDGWPPSTPLPAGANCEVNGDIVVLTFPVAAEGLAGADNGIRIYTTAIRGGTDPLVDITDEVDVYPEICQ